MLVIIQQLFCSIVLQTKLITSISETTRSDVCFMNMAETKMLIHLLSTATEHNPSVYEITKKLSLHLVNDPIILSAKVSVVDDQTI